MDSSIIVKCGTCEEPISCRFSKQVHCFVLPDVYCSDECLKVREEAIHEKYRNAEARRLAELEQSRLRRFEKRKREEFSL